MHEQNRLRLDRITARHAKHHAKGQGDAEADAAFLAGFVQARAEVLRPVMAEVGAQLERAGYGFEIAEGDAEGTPSIDLHVRIPRRGSSKDVIRFFAHRDAALGWQVIGEIELKRSPVELVRFEASEPITSDRAEQLIVDAVEQMFAST